MNVAWIRKLAVKDNYTIILQNNLDRLYADMPDNLAGNLPAQQDGERFIFDAFGEKCVIQPKAITLGEKEHSSVFGILISLYALNARPEICILSPFKSFKEFPGSTPYSWCFCNAYRKITHPSFR